MFYLMISATTDGVDTVGIKEALSSENEIQIWMVTIILTGLFDLIVSTGMNT